MAIVQISKIIHRTGSVSELPQLDIGEIGFASDEQRLFIGNDPAWVPPDGNQPTNTEILTNSPNCKIDFSQGSGTLNISIDNVQITGGSTGQVLSTDGSGNLSWVGVPGLSGNVTANIVFSTNNGNGTNFKVGDDAWIGDVNSVNTISIRGVQDATKGYITFGNASSTNKLGRDGSGPLTYTGDFTATGNVTTNKVIMSNWSLFANSSGVFASDGTHTYQVNMTQI
jgi:hypothetical protein